MTDIQEYFESCLFFSGSSFIRNIQKLSEIEFQKIGLSSSYAFVLIIVKEKAGISTGEIAKIMNMSSSTITRFVDKLVSLEYLNREIKGRTTKISLTQRGKESQKSIKSAWEKIRKNCQDTLGIELAMELTQNIVQANKKFK